MNPKDELMFYMAIIFVGSVFFSGFAYDCKMIGLCISLAVIAIADIAAFILAYLDQGSQLKDPTKNTVAVKKHPF